MNTIKRLVRKSVYLVLAAALLIGGFYGTVSGVKAASGTVDLVAVGTGNHQLYYIGQPGNGSCSSVRIPLVDTLSDTATFTLRPHTMVTLIETNWGDYWKVVNGAAVASTDVTVTGLEADFTATGTVTVTLPHGMSRDVKVCYEHVGTDADDLNWRAYGLGSDPTANVVKLPFKDEGVAYNHTLNLDAGDHNFPGGFIGYLIDPTATGFKFVVYDQTAVTVTVYGLPGVKVSLTPSCSGTTCVVNFPDGTTRADWSAPSVVYDWDGSGDEPETTGVNVTDTNALP